MPETLPATDLSHELRPEFIEAYKREWANIDYSDISGDQIRRIRHHYAALVERIDKDVGTIVDALRQSGKPDNTIVVFCSDHGDYLGGFGLVGKTYFHESSIRVPLIVLAV